MVGRIGLEPTTTRLEGEVTLISLPGNGMKPSRKDFERRPKLVQTERFALSQACAHRHLGPARILFRHVCKKGSSGEIRTRMDTAYETVARLLCYRAEKWLLGQVPPLRLRIRVCFENNSGRRERESEARPRRLRWRRAKGPCHRRQRRPSPLTLSLAEFDDQRYSQNRP